MELSTSSRDRNLPKQIGSYEVIDLLGKGGMGEVLKGRHTVLERDVAIKRLAAAYASDDDMVQRFFREGKSLARLSHQNICHIYDLFTYRGQHYMALEYVDGVDVFTLIKQRPLPYDVIAIIAARVADALDHAHFHGTIHRDIKPANIMVSRSGEVKLMDFGIALADDLDRVTATGSLVGTPSFLAPEVVNGSRPDEKSDLYALGVFLYEAVSGKKMFAHASAENLFALIVKANYVDIKKAAPDAPRAFCKIVRKCLHKNRDKRYADMAALRRDFFLFMASHSVTTAHSERLIAYLNELGLLSEEHALTYVDAGSLVQLQHTSIREPMPLAAKAAIVTSLSLAAGVAATAALSAEPFARAREWFEWVRATIG